MPFDLPITDPVLIVALAMAIFLASPLLAYRLGVPGIIVIILAGAVVGPNALNLLDRDPTIVLLGTVGLLYLVFLAGLELDLHRFAEYRRRSLSFGCLSFGFPMLLAALIGPALGFDLAASLLLGAIIGSHTLLAYPVASRLGLVKNVSVTTVVGGTLVTDTLALSVLAVIAGTLEGELTARFLLVLFGLLALYVAGVALLVPLVGRWFFKHAPADAPVEFIFLMAVLFVAAWLAGLAGAEPIIGAFLAGLTLNRLIPLQSPLMNRVRFIGNALFIPFFLLSVGMLVDGRVFVTSAEVWIVAVAIIAMVHVGKAAGVFLTSRVFHYTRDESVVMFGLSVPQAAATLAVTFVGLEIGLFDETVVNAVIMMILVTGLVGPALVDKYGRKVVFHEERKPFDADEEPPRILIPVANPATEESLLDIAFMLRGDRSDEPIYPLMVVPEADRGSEEKVAAAERLLGHAVVYAAGADVPVVPLTRIDRNPATGMARAVAETRASMVVVGWDGRGTRERKMFGSVVDQLLDQTRQLVIVAKLGHPLNLTRRIVLVVPPRAILKPGLSDALQAAKRIAGEQGAKLLSLVVEADPDAVKEAFDAVEPTVPAAFERVAGWDALRRELQARLDPDDLVVLLSARRGTVAWNRELERLPGELAELVPESFLVLYPPEEPTAPDRPEEARAGLPEGLDARRVVFDLPGVSHDSALQILLRAEFSENPQRLSRIAERAAEEARDAEELTRGAVLCRVEVGGVDRPLLFLGISPEGVEWPEVSRPPHLVFLLVTPPDAQSRAAEIRATVRRLVDGPERVKALAAADGHGKLAVAFRDAAVSGR